MTGIAQFLSSVSQFGEEASAEPDCLGALRWAKLQSLEPEWIEMMLSHVFIGVTDFPRAFAFYSVIMDELGFPLKFAEPEKTWAGWRPANAARPLLLIGRPYEGECASAGNGQMVALLAPTRAAVDKCYGIAIANGAHCEGEPGLRPQYHPDYYGAYFRDPDGNKLCVCCHDLE
ncbi:VOC family protein [Methylosinus sp. RM1]|uniref:VOC family protein n=1 Tax=Methylosinus sp. RM1 TaxID=2583817 RepID=UPI001FEDF0B8|nr:VOC family protein [Methylosinus sp. RM1]